MSLFRGDFRRIVAGKVRAEQLGAVLLKASSKEDWWKILVNSAKREGWVSVSWTAHGAARHQTVSAERAVWSFRIPLGEEEALTIEGPVNAPKDALDLAALAEILGRTPPQADGRNQV